MANTQPHCGSSETSEAAGHPWQSPSMINLLPGRNERPMNSLTGQKAFALAIRTGLSETINDSIRNTNKFPSPHYMSCQDSTTCLIFHRQDGYHHLTKYTSGVTEIP
jgi:hypothetical protein